MASNTCPIGPLSNYSGMICDTQKSNEPIVRYMFPPDFFVSSGTIPFKPEDVEILLDPNGEYTLLWSPIGPFPFHVANNQSIHIEATFCVEGGNTVNPWIHTVQANGTGKAWCEQRVLANQNGVAEQSFRADATVGIGAHDVRNKGGRYQEDGKPVWMRVTIHLEGGPRGSATMRSLGTHVNP